MEHKQVITHLTLDADRRLVSQTNEVLVYDDDKIDRIKKLEHQILNLKSKNEEYKQTLYYLSQPSRALEAPQQQQLKQTLTQLGLASTVSETGYYKIEPGLDNMLDAISEPSDQPSTIFRPQWQNAAIRASSNETLLTQEYPYFDLTIDVLKSVHQPDDEEWHLDPFANAEDPLEIQQWQQLARTGIIAKIVREHEMLEQITLKVLLNENSRYCLCDPDYDWALLGLNWRLKIRTRYQTELIHVAETPALVEDPQSIPEVPDTLFAGSVDLVDSVVAKEDASLTSTIDLGQSTDISMDMAFSTLQIDFEEPLTVGPDVNDLLKSFDSSLDSKEEEKEEELGKEEAEEEEAEEEEELGKEEEKEKPEEGGPEEESNQDPQSPNISDSWVKVETVATPPLTTEDPPENPTEDVDPEPIANGSEPVETPIPRADSPALDCSEPNKTATAEVSLDAPSLPTLSLDTLAPDSQPFKLPPLATAEINPNIKELDLDQILIPLETPAFDVDPRDPPNLISL